MPHKKHIAVIGAGVSGISVLRRLSENENFKLTCFERNYDIGGQWLYTDETSQNIFGEPISTAIYKNLQANLPKYLMEIQGFEHDDEKATFMERSEVFEYLTKITDSSNIRRFILFNTQVKHVQPVDSDNRNTKWIVTYGDVRKKNDNKCDTFDWVVVCNGNCGYINYPQVENEEVFEGTIIHSKQYRHPEMFVDQTIAILGGMFSGIDISIELSKYAKKVYLCHRKDKLNYTFPEKVEETLSGFKRFNAKSVVLENGCVLEVESVIYCTGYRYCFPFLPDGIVKIDEMGRISNLFKETLSADYATLAVMNIQRESAPFNISDNQALFIRAVLEEIAKLPEPEKMKEITFHEYTNRPVDMKTIWEWQRELSEIAGNFSPASTLLENIWKCNTEALFSRLDYKSYIYTFSGSDSVKVTRPAKH